VDEGWHIPHFEKMGVDNAALLSAYAEGLAWSGDRRFREVLTGTEAWVRSTLEQRDGGFGTSQDADNAPGDDGSYFTWTRRELRDALDDVEFRLVTRFFGVGSDGRMPHDPERNVLFRLMSVHDAAEGLDLEDRAAEHRLETALAKLGEVRNARAMPKVDPAAYASINGGFIRGFVRSNQVADSPKGLASAQKAADRFLAHAFAPELGVAHRLEGREARGYGLLEDQVEFSLGLLELSVATVEGRYLEAARTLLELVDREFRDETGLLRDVAPKLYDGAKVGSMEAATYALEDSPHLSANAAGVLAFERLASVTGEERWREAARRTLDPLMTRLRDAGLFASGTALAAGLLETPSARVVVEGDGAEADALYRAARAAWYPDLLVFRGAPPPPFGLPDELGAAASGSGGPARALVCFGTRCLAPVTKPDALSAAIRGGGSVPPE
jgi:uncharacterized protein YyaL (SSP411 family)